jgi:hypothetical protein
MANTPEERQRFRQALALIADKYRDRIAGNTNLLALLGADSGQFDQMVKFMDNDPFMTNLQLTGKPPIGCTVNGFTDYLTDPPTIFVNRTHASASTLIHELLHFLTHPNFTAQVQTRLLEGTTEYFTRKVQGIANPVTMAAFKSPRASYTEELREIEDARGFLKNVLGPMMPMVRSQPVALGRHRAPGFMPDPLDGLPLIRDFMKKAYFGGDPQSIALLKKIVALG